MSQGSLFDSVQDRLFDAARRASLREELGGSTPEQYEAWAARHAVGVIELPVAQACTVAG